jgi:hypothetical protein
VATAAYYKSVGSLRSASPIKTVEGGTSSTPEKSILKDVIRSGTSSLESITGKQLAAHRAEEPSHGSLYRYIAPDKLEG